MSLTPEQIRKIAHLARLKTTPAEEVRLGNEISEILHYLSGLQHLPTTAVTPQPDQPRQLPATDLVVATPAPPLLQESHHQKDHRYLVHKVL